MLTFNRCIYGVFFWVSYLMFLRLVFYLSGFFFPYSLLSLQARKHILEIHTRDWNPKLSEPFLDELAEKCVGKSDV